MDVQKTLKKKLMSDQELEEKTRLNKEMSEQLMKERLEIQK